MVAPTLAEQVQALEVKAARYDEAVARIMELEHFIKDWDENELPSNRAAMIAPVRRLVDFYKNSSPQFINDVFTLGFLAGLPKKYSNSTYDGYAITNVRVFVNGDVGITTTNGHEYNAGNVGALDRQTPLPSIDAVLLELDDDPKLVIQK